MNNNSLRPVGFALITILLKIFRFALSHTKNVSGIQNFDVHNHWSRRAPVILILLLICLVRSQLEKFLYVRYVWLAFN